MKDIMYIGSFVPSEIEQKSKYISSAANRFHKNFISNLSKHDVYVRGVSYICTPYENIWDDVQDDVFDEKVYFFRRKSRLVVALKSFFYVVLNMSKTNNIVVYNVDYVTWLVPIFAKLKKKRSILILADFSDDTCFDNSIRKIYAKVQGRAIQQYDVVIGLSERTKRFLKSSQQFLLIEGGIDRAFYDFFDEPKTPEKKKIVMYAGLLENVTGVDIWLRALKEIQSDDVEFVFTGKGSLANVVEEIAREDERVKFYGSVPYADYMKLLKKADILVNPRNMDLPENQNNFPSKIMEYLATGNRIVSTKFVGWEKYVNVIDFVESKSECIADGIVKALELNDNRYVEQREFAKRFLWENRKEIVEELL